MWHRAVCLSYSGSITVRVVTAVVLLSVDVGLSATIATLCRSGTWSGSGGPPSCVPCTAPPGFGCGPGSTSPTGTECPQGRYGTGGSSPCMPCPAGRFGSGGGVGVAECSGPCVAGPGRECTAGATSGEGSPRVYYMEDGWVLCMCMCMCLCMHVCMGMGGKGGGLT